MLSKTTIAYIRSLHNKWTRWEAGIFIVEWLKSIVEFLDSAFEIIEGFFIEDFVSIKSISFPYQIITKNELSRITTLTSNDSGILLVKMRSNTAPKIKRDELVLILDKINDPGNLWTIIRIADWYGIDHIVASRDTVDCYNPKVLMATMGSLSRVSIFYTNLVPYMSEIQWKVYGAYLQGDNIHAKKWIPDWGYLVIGSEAHGISKNLEPYITDKITIPRFGFAESLNAGIATAVILDRMRSEWV